MLLWLNTIDSQPGPEQMQDIILIIAIEEKDGGLGGVKAWGYFLNELILGSSPTGWVQKEHWV